ncbi:MAG: 1-deoxy-D-xylulose-5-phosphate reductoisomerase [Bacteroidetes bacterium]|nr:1-deoxy-D-xylulose-5-phosphate reductoisomerase [Bacteroidota bacterium]
MTTLSILNISTTNTEYSVQKNIAILGSTGSIGTQTLEVIAGFPNDFKVKYLTGNNNISLLLEQIRRFKPDGVVVFSERSAKEVKKNSPSTVEVLMGEEGLLEIVQRNNVDIVVSSLVGFAGLKPTIKAIESKKKIALANKETLVVAGEIIMPLVDKYRVDLLPVDSEHSAIFQCLVGELPNKVDKIILTASGGPFRTRLKEDLKNVTLEQALKHPNWTMGSKITIDSATLMNKGLEVIEAHWLFGVPSERIEVVIHPQSIIHSMVEFVDGSVKAQLGIPDMKIPIQYALTYPSRSSSKFPRVHFPTLSEMTFFEPDVERFPCLQLAFDALDEGGTIPAVMNAANEVAVAKFLKNEIGFLEIPKMISRMMEKHSSVENPSLEEIVDADKETRALLQS